MTSATIRPATAADLPAIEALLAATGLPTIGAADHLSGFLVADHGGAVIASAGLEWYGPHALLRSVAVDPGRQGKRLGHTMVTAALDAARAREAASVTLLTTSAEDYFPRFGFRRIEPAAAPAAVRQSTQFNGVCPASAVTMRLDLISHQETTVTHPPITTIVKEKYGQAAARVAAGGANSCCGGAASCGTPDPITSNLYDEATQKGLPVEAVLASLGCGNPTALADLKPGEVVLDLGSGGGIDVLLSAKRVGPTGKAYGLDMTDEMLALARANQAKSGLTNVEFLRGQIENVPLPGDTADVIISNCVINLSADKDKVLAEAFRVLKPGGRFAVSDVVVRGEVPADLRRNMELWVGCIAGALQESEYRAKLAAAGFTDISVEPTRVYRVEDAREFLAAEGIDADRMAPEVDGKFMSAFIRATKPAAAAGSASPAAACCQPGCCGN